MCATKNVAGCVQKCYGKTIYINEMLPKMLAQYKDKRMIILYAVCLSLFGLCWAKKTFIFILGTLTIMTVGGVTKNDKGCYQNFKQGVTKNTSG